MVVDIYKTSKSERERLKRAVHRLNGENTVRSIMKRVAEYASVIGIGLLIIYVLARIFF